MKKITARLTVLLLALTMVFSLCGCSFNGGLTIGRYVDNVKNDVHEIVNTTREIKKQQENLDCRNKKEADLFIESLDKLSDLYTDISKLNAPDRYDDLDDRLKDDSEKAIGYLAQLREMVNTARETGDDSLYRQLGASVTDSYNEVYLDITDVGSQVTTRFRND